MCMLHINVDVKIVHRRYDYITVDLHRGTQCSSCGLRFREENNEKYRQHLDWHFRINRKEKEIVAAHRNWFITTDVRKQFNVLMEAIFYSKF